MPRTEGLSATALRARHFFAVKITTCRSRRCALASTSIASRQTKASNQNQNQNHQPHRTGKLCRVLSFGHIRNWGAGQEKRAGTHRSARSFLSFVSPGDYLAMNHESPKHTRIPTLPPNDGYQMPPLSGISSSAFRGVIRVFPPTAFGRNRCPLSRLVQKSFRVPLDHGITLAGVALKRSAVEYGNASAAQIDHPTTCLLYTSPSPRDGLLSRMPSSA